jgi:hypothetical protein
VIGPPGASISILDRLRARLLRSLVQRPHREDAESAVEVGPYRQEPFPPLVPTRIDTRFDAISHEHREVLGLVPTGPCGTAQLPIAEASLAPCLTDDGDVGIELEESVCF